jgi:hypothetical protein
MNEGLQWKKKVMRIRIHTWTLKYTDNITNQYNITLSTRKE